MNLYFFVAYSFGEKLLKAEVWRDIIFYFIGNFLKNSQ